jgi:hypothetical protein
MGEKQKELMWYILSLTPEQIEKAIKYLPVLRAIIAEQKEQGKEEAAAS